MNEKNSVQTIADILRTGTIPYRYEFDTATAVYFGAAVLFVIFAFAFFQQLSIKLLN